MSPRSDIAARCPSLRAVRIDNVHEVEPFTTIDGSQIREIAGRAVGTTLNQSLAEATVPPGGTTVEHFHRETEEIYFFMEGQGRMRLAADECEVRAGDAVVIAPGIRHKVWATGEEPLRFLCCCSPAYSHEDTVLTE
jgi:mannose-6-phosphate isomerase-like protein (cupin superfamily)